jgi:hypothetical protein
MTNDPDATSVATDSSHAKKPGAMTMAYGPYMADVQGVTEGYEARIRVRDGVSVFAAGATLCALEDRLCAELVDIAITMPDDECRVMFKAITRAAIAGLRPVVAG